MLSRTRIQRKKFSDYTPETKKIIKEILYSIITSEVRFENNQFTHERGLSEIKREFFRYLDPSEEAVIGNEEFTQALLNRNIRSHTKNFKLFFNMLDQHGNGFINFCIEQQAPDLENHSPSDDIATLVTTLSNKNEVVERLEERLGVYQGPYGPDLYWSFLPILGPYQYSNGAVFTGQFKNGIRWGEGRQIWEDGSTYEGQWENDKLNGYGRLITCRGDVYEGEWIDSQPTVNTKKVL